MCVWETKGMAKNEKVLKMKRDKKKKTEGKFRTRLGKFKGLSPIIDMLLKQVYCGGPIERRNRSHVQWWAKNAL